MYVCMYVRVNFVCMCVCMCEPMYMCVCICLYVHMYVLYFILSYCIRPRKRNCLFPVTVFRLFRLFFVQKCVFYACFMLIGSCKGRKVFRIGIFWGKNLLG